MTVYLILLSLITILAVQNDSKKSKKWQYGAFFLPVVCIVLIIGLRNPNMGVDLDRYLPSFDRLSSYTWGKVITMPKYLNYQKGYVIFNKLIGSIYSDRQFFIFCCALISIVLISVYIFKTSKLPLLSLILYLGLPCFLTVFSALRQAIAISICAIALLFVLNKKPIIFIALVLIASTFHSSALLFLVSYPLFFYKPSPAIRGASVVLLLISYVFREPIFIVLSKLVKDNAVIDNNNSITLFLVFTAIYVFMIALVDRTDKKNTGLLNIFWIACFCQSLAGLNNIAIRVGYYFMLPAIPLLINILCDNGKKKEGSSLVVISNEKQRIFIIGVVYICFAVFGLYTLRHGSWAESYPYYWFWEDYSIN